MLSEATSGFSSSAGCNRSSIVIVGAPPVVKLMTTSERRAMSGANSRKYLGSCVGRPSTGSRACRWTMAAPRAAPRTGRARGRGGVAAPRLGRRNGGIGDLFRRDRQVRRHRRRVDRAGDGGRGDHLAGRTHFRILLIGNQ